MDSAQDLITQLPCFSGSGSQPVLCPKHGFEQSNSSDRSGIVAASILSTVRCKWPVWHSCPTERESTGMVLFIFDLLYRFG